MTTLQVQRPPNLSMIRIAAEHLAEAPIQSTNAFYARLFQVAPGVRPLFPEDMFQQSEKLWDSIVAVVESADDLERLRPILKEMGKRHAGYGAEPAHYDVVNETLLKTIAEAMADKWTEPQADAWAYVLRQVADMMIEGANEPGT